MLTNITRMNMTASPSKFALLTHITFSVGWFGAVVPYPAGYRWPDEPRFATLENKSGFRK
ncbi:MAG TPA: hypothetical protein VHY30_11010 [Verrucomicrobiae bacterium]|jgi:hypothetical protein|nr:hypothetical protein [Verrucomicrobiae bacterium]